MFFSIVGRLFLVVPTSHATGTGWPFFIYLVCVALRLSTGLEYRDRGSWGICQGLASRDAADCS